MIHTPPNSVAQKSDSMNCEVCDIAVTSNEESTECFRCHNRFHNECVKIPLQIQEWFCKTCATYMQKDENRSFVTTRSSRMMRRLALRQLADEKAIQEDRVKLQLQMDQLKINEEFVKKKYQLLHEDSGDDEDGEEMYSQSRKCDAASERKCPMVYEEPDQKLHIPAATTSNPGYVHNLLSPNQLAARHVVPKDLPSFSGRPEEWPMFYSNFERSTQICGYTNDENLIRLQRCLKGDALEVVRSRLMLPELVPGVIETLKMLFGRPELILHKMLTTIRNQPAPKPDRLETIVAFSLDVQNLCATMTASGLLSHLNNPMLLQELVDKLPPQVKLNWATYQLTQPLANLATFGAWIQQIGTALCMVTTSTFSIQPGFQERQRKPIISIQNSSLHAHTETNNDEISKRQIIEQLSEISDVDARWELVKQNKVCGKCLGNHYYARCKSSKPCGRNGCQLRHHELLHNERYETINNQQVNAHATNSTDKKKMFRIVPVVLYGPSGVAIRTHAFLDDGSNLTLLEEGLAKQLDLQGTAESLCLQWTANVGREERDSRRVTLKISSTSKNAKKYAMRDVRTVRALNLPVQSMTNQIKSRYQHLDDVPIEEYTDAIPRILIGVDNSALGIPKEIREGAVYEPIATRTRLGWTIHGICNHHQSTNKDNYINYKNVHSCDCSNDTELHVLMKEFISIENMGVKIPNQLPTTQEEKRARIILSGTTHKMGNRYETGLLWRYDKILKMPDSYEMALRRLSCLDRKMAKDDQLASNLKTQIKDYVDKGYARKLTSEELKLKHPRTWYLPVFVVLNPNKPGKVRMVWDAAAKVDGVSLNTFLLKGPDQLTTLTNVLYGFRQKQVAICGDIKEMFHQVKIRPEDQHSQRFLWRNEETKNPDVYVMEVMTFGASCSPCSAQFVKNLNAKCFEEQYPRATRSIICQHYVDDLLDSVDTEDEAINLAKEIRHIHKQGGFEIRNWLSNSTAVLHALTTDNFTTVEKTKVEVGPKHSTSKVLGMWWNTEIDTFSFKISYERIEEKILRGERKPTKREVLRILMMIFDPLGILSSFLVFVKILLQKIWESDVGWDEEIKNDHFEDWLEWVKYLPCIEQIRTPRCYGRITSASRLQLHTFVDASENAYSAAVYIRIQNDQHVEIALVGAKTRVASSKPMTIPRLELQAALLGARLTDSIQNGHTMKFERRKFWSDSKTVLCWLRSSPRSFRQFVSFRIGEILELTDLNEWRWVPTNDNVADDATKWKSIPDLSPQSRWFNGPSFLTLNEECWPIDKTKAEDNQTKEEIRYQMLHIEEAEPIYTVNIDRFDKWRRLHRAQATLVHARKIFNSLINKCPRPQSISCDDLQQAFIELIAKAQHEHFPLEITALRTGNIVNKTSSILQYSPYLDENGILRVRGRIDAAPNVNDEVKRPIILPRHHKITYLIINDYHLQYYHINQETVINEIKQRFVIPKLRQAVKNCRSHCQHCKNERSRPQPPEMAALPKSRLTSYTRPFTYVGIDYFGPMMVTVGRHREKRWGVLFTCMTVRAIHLEVAYSLSTDSCIMCIRNFIARRGKPLQIFSDNGTNFHGADKELRTEIENINKERIRQEFETIETKWTFNPPATPHMGGSWERLIGSVKRTLHKIQPTRTPTDELLRSLLMEAENVVNSRPLTEVSVENYDMEALTPNHFLIGSSNGNPSPGIFSNSDLILRKNWRKSQLLADEFWRRWVREYLPTLTRRTKWFQDVKPIEVGDIVIIVDDTAPRNTWSKGFVVQTIAGKDGQVRRATVQTKNGILERPAVKLAVLDVKKEM